jgi:hypothetical protein
MPFEYQAYGLSIVSEIELPALYVIKNEALTDFIKVSKGIVPLVLVDTPTYESENFMLNEQEWLYRIASVANYYVANGTQIFIEPLCDKWDEILLYFYSNCLTAALMQRDLLPFHVSGVLLPDGRALLFAAQSGGGKSTTAIKLQERGYRPFTDDTALLRVQNGQCYATASYPMIRLWQNSIDQQNRYTEADKQYLTAQENKYGFGFHAGFVRKSVPVAAVVFLEKDDGVNLHLKPLKPVQTMQALGQNIYRQGWIAYMNKQRLLYDQLTTVASVLPSYQLTRPARRPTFEAVADLIETQIIQPLVKMQYQINTQKVLFTQLGDEGVVYQTDTNEYLTLNETMFKILKGIENGQTEADIVAQLQAEYNITEAECRTAVRQALQSMAEKAIIVA